MVYSRKNAYADTYLLKQFLLIYGHNKS